MEHDENAEAGPGTEPESDSDSDSDSDSESESESGEEARRRFREALERKKSGGTAHLGPRAESGSHLKGSNTRQRREFRRKSG